MRRVKIINALFFIISLVFFLYIGYIQCIRFRHYQKVARREHEQRMVLAATRGNIYDRQDQIIASSAQCFSIFCTPRYSNDPRRLARDLAALSRRTLSDVSDKISAGTFFWIERKVPLEKKEEYLALKDPSIGFCHDIHRRYNLPELFTSVVGRCSSDNQGIEGLEYYFDDLLRGKSGFVVYQRSATGDLFPYVNHPEKDPEPGRDLYLTIDLQLQSILYAHLKNAMEKESARAASGIVVDPRTGEILAMANIGSDKDTRNHAVCDEFEPGSTFKIVPLAFALLNGAKSDNTIDTEGGKIKVANHVVRDYRDYGVVTLREAIAHSSNVAMVKLSKDFDRRDYFVLLRDFGFTQPTGIELPGEVSGRVPDPGKMNNVEFATLSFGQGITCSFLQLVFAYQAIANDGMLCKPIIVREVRHQHRTVYRARPLRVRTVMDATLAQRITDILCTVVDKGSGTEARVDGIRIAGKTGTAQKVVDGRYSSTKVIATFIGYFPADDPEYLVGIMLDEPSKGLWASTIACPAFKQIAQSIWQMNGHEYAAQ